MYSGVSRRFSSRGLLGPIHRPSMAAYWWCCAAERFTSSQIPAMLGVPPGTVSRMLKGRAVSG